LSNQSLNQSRDYFIAQQSRFQPGEPQWLIYQDKIDEVDVTITLFSKWFDETLNQIPATRPYKYFINDDTTGKLIFGTNDFFLYNLKGKHTRLKIMNLALSRSFSSLPEAKLEKSYNEILKSVVRKIRTLRSVGVGTARTGGSFYPVSGVVRPRPVPIRVFMD